MVWQRIRIALFVCTVLAVSASTAFAQEDKDKKGEDKDKQPEKIGQPVDKGPLPPPHHPNGGPGGPGGDGCGNPCGGTRTIWVTECVPETYQARRTVYRTECRTENYTAYRCERVP